MEIDALCFIPARGGSKRTPRKNLLPLNGKPLLSYTVKAAKDSGVFKDIVVSSDDEEILNLALSYGVSIDKRPQELSGDTTRAVEVLYEFIKRQEMRKKYKCVANMLPTCPFRTSDDVRKAFNLFIEHNFESFLIAITEFDFPPQLAIDIADDNHTLIMRDPAIFRKTTRSQDLGKAYHPNGAIYIASTEGYLREKTFFAEPLIGYKMPPERSFDIDYPYQFEIAEFMMRKGQHNI